MLNQISAKKLSEEMKERDRKYNEEMKEREEDRADKRRAKDLEWQVAQEQDRRKWEAEQQKTTSWFSVWSGLAAAIVGAALSHIPTLIAWAMGK